MPAAIPATILTLDRDHCIAVWNRTLIQIWRRATTAAAAQQMCETARTFAASQPDKISILFVIEAASEVPGDQARKGLTKFLGEVGPRTSCMVAVPEGGSFRAAIVRSIGVAAGAVLLRFPLKFAATVEEGIDTLAPDLPPAPAGVEGLRSAVAQLRAHLAEHDAKR